MFFVSKRWRWLVALVPLFPPLYFVSFAFLKHWRVLGPTARRFVLFFLATQLLAALFTPNPLLSLPLAAVRSLFIISLLIAGSVLREVGWFRYLLWGITAVLVIALYTSWIHAGGHFLLRRLSHPYYSTVSLALAAAIVLWYVIDWSEAPLWTRAGLAIIAVAALLYSGSRGALIGFTAGVVAAAAFAHQRRYLTGTAITAGIIATAYLLTRFFHILPLERLLNLTHLSGRDEVWRSALHAFSQHPIGGVGPYQLGPWLDKLYNHTCTLWHGLVLIGYKTCPDWLLQFYGFWLIAHNTILHSLGETGVIGTAGLVALLGLVGYAALRSQNAFLISLFFGYMVLGLVDNPISVPSLHLAEAFWVAGGMALAQAGLTIPLEQRVAVDDDQLGPDAL